MFFHNFLIFCDPSQVHHLIPLFKKLMIGIELLFLLIRDLYSYLFQAFFQNLVHIFLLISL